jgi:two-component system LytT family response regulator
MANLKAIIVDEERLARVNLRRLLEPFPEIEIAGESSSCAGTLELISLHNPQLIFLDIQLRGETCFDLLELIDNSIKIIFVTAYDEYAIRAFDVNADDYLSKPVNPDRLRVAIEKVKNSENNPKSETKSYEYSDSILVTSNNYSSRFTKISSITFIEPLEVSRRYAKKLKALN